MALVGDGQVSLGQTVMKRSARKVRKLHHDRIIAGFAGSTADAFTLFEKFDAKLQEFRGNLTRAAVADNCSSRRASNTRLTPRRAIASA